MSESAEPQLDNPDLVQWSPRHGATVGSLPVLRGFPLSALGAVVFGALAAGVFSLGVAAIVRLVAGRPRSVRRLQIGDLVLRRRSGRPF